jgi:hypothetical protein
LDWNLVAIGAIPPRDSNDDDDDLDADEDEDDDEPAVIREP